MALTKKLVLICCLIIATVFGLKIMHTIKYQINMRPNIEPIPFYSQNTPKRKLMFPERQSPSLEDYNMKHDDVRSEDIFNKFLSENVVYVKDTTADDYFIEGEKELLEEGEIKDLRDLPSSNYSIISTKNTVFNQYEAVTVKIQLYNGFGQLLKRGGDDVRVWITGENFQAGGEVYDLHNGTYVAEVKAFWTGKSKIHVSIAYSREELRILLRTRRESKVLRYSVGRFLRGGDTFMTLCSPFHDIPLYPRVCNFTNFNLNPYYCGQPNSPKVACSDLRILHTINYSKQRMNNLESKILSRQNRVNELKSKSITINIGTVVNLPYCSSYKSRFTWTNTAPLGYFNNNTWHPSFCQGQITRQRLSRCIRDLHVYLVGDSTVRQIFQSFLRLTKCTNTTFIGNRPHDRVQRYCDVHDSNFRVEYGIHGLPYSMVRTPDLLNNTKAIGFHLDGLQWSQNKDKMFVMVHLYAHFLFFHTSLFEARVRSLKVPLTRLLNRYPKIKIFIKGPHAFTGADFKPIVKSDYFGKVYRSILLKELFEFRDRVYYLDYWDMSVSSGNRLLHPVNSFVDEMVKFFLNLACDK
ncbi:hypothetical protein LOTGIDRAFT_166736 [Lottia gigantea]|uniref:NXPE C-terminal domain-containing protein n=1 Tax=Lottia gigantea TaxID=225164 RepID=V4A140_LOTGI|nr:hypothetical protein LOTGIDRAFT_166736 [Lottia gigantea]ESO87001.1 hypothetical protein LOTGIDRAFT_166736 [Lottia gigantea]